MTEAQIQAQLIKWWRIAHKGIGVPDARLLYHVPNGAYFGAGEKANGAKLAVIRFVQLKRQGFVPGVPDLKLAVMRIHAGQIFGGLYLEMKKPGGVLRPEQKEIHPLLRAQGYRVEVAFSFEQAVDVITTYLAGQRLRVAP